ncbi:MAG: hypothetical protein I8H68_11865 [Flavobacteriia bacterium]|nr:hypothetical protein [Flavobacteriia bacterium]MBH2023455.1 hypothetical protein [Flavobacteriales bacterium]
MKALIILFLFICFSQKFKCQTVINDNIEVKIIFPFENVKFSLGQFYLFEIKNDSNFNYFIDTSINSFVGRATILKNSEFLTPNLYYPSGYPAEREYDECGKDFQIIMKGEQKNVLLPIFKYNGTYEIDSKDDYKIVINNQTFSKGISSDLGCSKYIAELENKNYKLLEGYINLKLKLVE